MWLSFQTRYGVNEDMYAETAVSSLYYGTKYDLYFFVPYVNEQNSSFYNIHRLGTTLEYGAKLHEKFTLITGLGYQVDFLSVGVPNEDFFLHGYAVFIQGQYKLNDNVIIVPQVGYFGNMYYGDGQYKTYNASMKELNNTLMAAVQFSFLF